MSISLISNGYHRGEDGNVTMAATAVLANDLILVGYGKAWNTAPTNDPPTIGGSATGVTAICAKLSYSGSDRHFTRMYYKVAVGGEESDVIEMSHAARGVLSYAVLRGVDVTTGPFDVTPVHATHHTKVENNTAYGLPAITTVTDGAWVLHWSFQGTQASGSLPTTDLSGATTIDGIAPGVSSVDNAGFLWTYKEITTAAAVSGVTHTHGGVTTPEIAGMTLAIMPAAAASGGAALVGGTRLVG